MKYKKVIISGGPGFGKTSIINELEHRNFECMHEVSRAIIKEQLETGGDILPWKNLSTFSRLLFERRVKQFDEASENNWVFFDRGLPDIIAYMGKEELEIPSNYLNKIQVCNYYPNVFIVPPWKEIYAKDAERKEDFNTASSLHQYITDTYNNLGYNTVILPQVSVQERVNFILNYIEKNN